MILYIDNENNQKNDHYKKMVLETLANTYDNVGIPKFSDNAHVLLELSKHIKRTKHPVIIWNNLKPFCRWAIDLCLRFDKDYVIVERGLVPSQGEDNFSFFAGGICFDNLNISPEYFDESTFDKNCEIITSHYTNNKLVRLPEKNKVVFIGQLLWDSTMTHYFDIDNYEQLISHVINTTPIDPNNTEVVFCPHPRDPVKEFKYKVSQQQTIRECLDASQVFAVSSTTIYEAYGLNIPISVVGGGPMTFPTYRNWKDKYHCLSTALDYHFNTSTPPDEIKNKINKIVEITRNCRK